MVSKSYLLSDGRGRRNWLHLVEIIERCIGIGLTICSCCATFTRYVPSLSTIVADFAGRVQRTSIGSSAVAGDMALEKSISALEILENRYSRACRMHSIS